MWTKLIASQVLLCGGLVLVLGFEFKVNESEYMKPERVEKIATKLLKLTLNTSEVQVSHCVRLPKHVHQKEPTFHFHVNVISDIFIDMPIFVRKNITINILKTLLDKAGPHDLSIDCFCTDERPTGFLDDDLTHQVDFAIGESIIEDILHEEFNKTFLPKYYHVENVCELYGVHRSQESHFQVVIVSDEFEGKTWAERRYMVESIVKRTMAVGLVRLFLKLFTEREWAVEIKMEKEHGPRRSKKYYDEMRDYGNMEN